MSAILSHGKVEFVIYLKALHSVVCSNVSKDVYLIQSSIIKTFSSFAAFVIFEKKCCRNVWYVIYNI